jgi:hypothetical protein
MQSDVLAYRSVGTVLYHVIMLDDEFARGSGGGDFPTPPMCRLGGMITVHGLRGFVFGAGLAIHNFLQSHK